MILYSFSVMVVLGVIVLRSWLFYVVWKRKRDAEMEAEFNRVREWAKTAKPDSYYTTNCTQIFRHAIDREKTFVFGVDIFSEDEGQIR